MPRVKQQDLTPTQTVVLERLHDGRTTKEIAAERGVTEASVYNHITRIRAKGYDIPARDNGGAPSGPAAASNEPTAPSLDVASEGLVKDDDLDLLAALSAPLAENASALLDGLQARRREIAEELKDKHQLVADTQAKITALEGRGRLFEERMQAAANVAEALKPLVVS